MQPLHDKGTFPSHIEAANTSAEVQKMKTYKEPPREIPISRDVDVIIIGGGPAGLVAAIASARNAARTTLVEQFAYLGGTATAALMPNINGFRNQV